VSARHIIALTSAETGAPRGALTWHEESSQLVSTGNAENAYQFTDRDEAQRTADDFNDYWTTKGRDLRAHVTSPETEKREPMAPIVSVDLTPTWPEAARIIAAALENGTGTGREMARAELFRMAAILDSIQQPQSDQEKPSDDTTTGLYEVIAHSRNGAAFGQTFTNEATADSYAERLRAEGYEVDPYPAYDTQPDLAAALSEAAHFFKDRRLTQ